MYVIKCNIKHTKKKQGLLVRNVTWCRIEKSEVVVKFKIVIIKVSQ